LCAQLRVLGVRNLKREIIREAAAIALERFIESLGVDAIQVSQIGIQEQVENLRSQFAISSPSFPA